MRTERLVATQRGDILLSSGDGHAFSFPFKATRKSSVVAGLARFTSLCGASCRHPRTWDHRAPAPHPPIHTHTCGQRHVLVTHGHDFRSDDDNKAERKRLTLKNKTNLALRQRGKLMRTMAGPARDEYKGEADFTSWISGPLSVFSPLLHLKDDIPSRQ